MLTRSFTKNFSTHIPNDISTTHNTHIATDLLQITAGVKNVINHTSTDINNILTHIHVYTIQIDIEDNMFIICLYMNS